MRMIIDLALFALLGLIVYGLVSPVQAIDLLNRLALSLAVGW
jgi:hypothetical protein